MRRAAVIATGSVGLLHVLPAATWLPPVRRLIPALESPMSAGQVAVTFDDGPHPLGTPAILDRLDELGWHATFFMLGSAVSRFPDIAVEVTRRGHQVGVHGFDHRYLIARAPQATWMDMSRAMAVIAEMTATTPRWWRPPYGVLSAASVAAAAALRLRPLLWSTWGKDWTSDATGSTIAGTIAQGRLDAGTILLHDSDALSAPGSWRRTRDALPRIAEELSRRGVTVAPIP